MAAVPKNWNGALVVFAHGGPSLIPYSSDYSRLDLDKFAILVKRGFAWVASSYRREGYGVRLAAEDTEHAREFFVEHFGQPRRTLLQGASYGALVAVKVLEKQAQNPQAQVYEGAVLNSGLLAGPLLGYEFRVDLRVVYQYVCRNLPSAGEAEYPLWQGLSLQSKFTLKDIQSRIDECTGATKRASDRTLAQQQSLDVITKVIGIPDNLLFRHMQSATLLFRGLAQDITGGKSPFSNVGIRYKGSSDDERLNRQVARFSADSGAVAALRADGDPTGTIGVPVVSIHAIRDPQVVVESQSVFRERVNDRGNGTRLVQAYTDDNRHNFHSDPELAAGFDALLRWIELGEKPTAHSLAVNCVSMSASHDGACRFRPEFTPAPYHTRYYHRGEVATNR